MIFASVNDPGLLNRWRWGNFTPAEVASKGDGSLLLHEAGMDALQRARDIAQAPFRITSAYRDPLHNARVGGAPRSSHKEGHAFDIALARHDREELIAVLTEAGFRGLGINYRTFVHADLGRFRRW